MSQHFTESIVEDAALAWLESPSYAVLHLRASARAAAAGPQSIESLQVGVPNIALRI